MKVVTADETREMERRCVSEGISLDTLMQNAGLAVARKIREYLGHVAGQMALVLVGPGNNGGDGLVAARHLRDWGAQVHVYLCSPRAETDPNLSLVVDRGIPVTRAVEDAELAALKGILVRTDLVLDAVLGTGRLRPLEGLLKEVLETVGAARKKCPGLTVFALDLPSGLNADSGAVDPSALPADVTITLAFPKRGLFGHPGYDYVGTLFTVDIGIPGRFAEEITTQLLTTEWVRSALPARPKSANKGTFGRVLVVAGSINYIGAAYLVCQGAARSGAGVVTLAVAQTLQPVLAAKLTEVTYAPLPEAEPGVLGPQAVGPAREALSGREAALVGCGLGQHPATGDFLKALLFDTALPPLVLDADGLNIVSREPQWWRRIKTAAVVTPHPGEMARLLGASVAEVQVDRFEAAQRAAREWGMVVVLKGACTIVASPSGETLVSPFANPGLASAGTGDVLAGVIVSLLGQGMEPGSAAACGVYLHGLAGEMIRQELGDMGMLASDLLPALPRAIKGIREAG